MKLPFLKKKLFYLFLVLLVLLACSTGLLFTKVPENTLTKEEEALALQDAGKEIEQKLTLATEEEKESLMESLYFYQTAEEFSLSPWSDSFHSQWASLYGKILLSEEISGKERQEEKDALVQILNKKDKDALLSFYEGYLSTLSFSEEKKSLLLSSAKTCLLTEGNDTPGKRALLYDVSLIEKSLQEGKDYFSGSTSNLDQKERNRLSSLLSLNLTRLETGEFDPVYTNSAYLSAGENIVCLGLCLLSLYCAHFLFPIENKVQEKIRLILSFSVFLALLTLILSLPLALTTAFFAKGSVLPQFFVTEKGFYSLPFFIGLFLRLLVNTFSYLPLITLYLFVAKEKKDPLIPKVLSLISCLYYIFKGVISFLPQKIFSLFDPVKCFFPSLNSFTPKGLNPLWCLAFWGFLFLLVFAFSQKKKIKK